MNKIFKVIWSHATQTFVVVSELTHSKSKAKASVSDVKKNGVSSLITSGFKLSAISSLLISAIPTAYAAVAINNTQGSGINTNGVQVTGSGIAIGSSAGYQQTDGYTSNTSAEAKRNAYHLQSAGGGASNNTVSLGTNAYAGGEDSVAIGTRAQAVHNVQTTNMAYNSRGSYNAGAVAIGFQSIARGDQTVALGSRAAAYNRQATAIGNDSYAMGVGSVVIGGDDSGYAYESINGTGKQAWANNSGNLGYTNLATGFNPSNEPNKADYRPSAASGNGATVVGVHSQALSKGSTALGVAATAGDGGKTSSTIKDGQIVGIDSTQNIEATAIGALAHARDRNTTAVGHAAKAYSDYSTSIGDDAVAEGKNSSAVGKSSYAKGDYSVAIGNAEDTTNADRVNATKVIANGLRAIAIGTSARTDAPDTIAFGTRTESTAGGAISMGFEAKSKALDAIVIGSGTEINNAKAEGGIAIGNRAGKQDLRNYGVAKVDVASTGYKQQNFAKNIDGAQQDKIEMGTNAYAYGHDSIAIGTRSQAVFNDDADGTSRNSLNSGAIAIGYQTISNGDQAISLGSRAEALNRQAMALGNDAFASGVGAIVIGGDDSLPHGSAADAGYQLDTGFVAADKKYRQSAATGNGAVVVGVHSQALSQGSTAIGVAATAGDNGETRTATNVTTITAAKEATAVGAQSRAKSERTTAVGYSSEALGVKSTTVGANTKAESDYSFAAGYNSTANGIHSAALGSSAETKGENAIAIGTSAKSLANNTISLGSKANTSIEGAVALGANSASDRQLNVDATTKPFIPATATTNEAKAINDTIATTGAVSVGAKGGSNSPAVRRQITNLAAGAEDSDAVNVAQLKAAVTTAVASSTWNIKENTTQKDVVNSGDNVSFDNGTGTTANVSVSQDGKTSTVKYSVNKSNLNVATDGTVTAANTGDNFATADQVAQAINKSEKTTTINNSTTITATPTTTGTVTTYDLDLSKTTKDDIQKGVDAHTTVTTKGLTFTADAGTPTERKLGETLAINGDKTLINTTVEAGKVSVAATKKLQDAVVSAESALQEIVTTADGKKAQTVKKGSNEANFVSGKNIALTPSDKGITVATQENVDFTTVNATTVNGNTIKSGNVVINQDGINAGDKKITHVADGNVTNDSKEAVNGSQLYATNQNVTNNTNNIAKNTADIAKGTVYAGDYAKDDSVKNEFTQALGNQTNVVGGASKNDLSDKNIGVVSDGVNTLTVKLAKTLEGLTSATFGNDANDQTVINNNGMTINSTDPTKTVSLTESGLNNGDNRITNVAKGQDGTDAVNLSQLKEYVGDNSYNWNISDGEKTANVPDNNTVSVKGSVKTADSATENGIVTKLDGTDITVDLSDKAKQDIADGKKHSSVKGDTNVLVEVNNTANSDGGKQYDVKLADTVVIGKDKVDGKPVTIDGTTGEISGLTNTTWNPNETYTGGKSATQEQLKAVSDVAHLGWNVQTNDTPASKVAPGETVKFVDGKNIKVTSNGKDITIATADNVVTTETDKYVTGGKVDYDNQGNGTTTLTLRDGSTADVKGVKNNFVTEAETAKDGKTATLTRNDGGKVNIDLTNTVNQAVTEATEKGTHYEGDKPDTGATANNFKRKLGETTKVLGGAQGELSDNNIGVVSNGSDTLTVKLAKSLTDLTNATFGSNDDKTVINKDGVTITNGADANKTVSLTDGGLNNGGNKITNVAKGDADTDAVNVSQLNQAIKDSAYNWNISDGKTEQAVPDNGKVSVKGSANDDSKATSGIVTTLTGTDITVDLSDKSKQDIADGKKHSSVEGDANVVVTQTTTNKDGGKQYDVKLADKVSIGSDKATTVTIDGTKGTVSGLTNTTWDPNKEYTGGQAATQEQLKSVSDVANSGWNISANGQNESNVGPKGKVSFNNTDGNVLISKETTDNNVTFNLNNDLTVGGAGKDGKDGKDGTIGVKGADGKDGVTLNGKDGSIGLTGAPGKDGQDAQATIKVVDGTKGLDGNNGKDGESKTRIVYEKPNGGGTEEIATLNDGLNFVGDKGQVIRKKLNDTLAIKGNLDANATVTDKNLRVDNDKDQNGELIIKMAKSLTDLTNATFSSDDSNTVIGGNGLTITPKAGNAVSLTDKGLNNGNNTITNVKAGENDTDAVNVSQLKEVKNTANAGWNISANGQNETNVAPKGSVSFNNTDGNVVITKAADNNNVTFNLNNDLTVGGPAGKDGKDGKDGTIGVKGKDGTTGVTLNGKDGSIGLTGAKGADGKDGANATITVANGPVGVDGTDGKDGKDGMTRIVYTDPKGTTHNVSTLNDGLNFAGNQGDTIAKKLNETLTVKGDLANDAAASSENLRVDSQDGALVVKLAQNLANLTTATFGNTDTDKTVVSKDGVTISSDKPEKEVSLTDKGLNNGNNQITNVTSGLTDSTGQKSDLANATTTNAVNVGDLKDTVNNLTNATTGGFGLKDDNNTEVKQDLGKTIQIKGKDGVTVTSDVANKSLEVALQGDVTVNGKDGKDGTIGVKGADGKDGTKITKDAVVFNGVDGKDGKDGQVSIKVEQGPKGIAGNDGKDGESKTRIVYEKPNGDKEQVATLNDGLNFVGDKGKVIAKKLNETLAIKGNLDANATVTDKNLRVDNDKDQNGELIIKMAKSLTDLTNATFSSGDINATIGGNGLTITPKGGDVVSLTDKGLNNGNNTITNVAPGVNGTDAVNKDQLDDVNATANAGWNLTTNGDNTNASNVAPNSTVDLANTDGNIVITKAGNNVTFDLNNNLTVGGPGKDGKPGKDGEFGVKGADGKTGVALNGKDGTIGINGKDGSNGSITVKQGKPGVDGKDGETKTRIVYETKDETGKPTTEEVATLNDGLKFVGDTGEVIAKKLNETLAIKGNLTATAAVTDKNLRVDNENGQLIVKMAKSLTDLTNATFGSDNSNTTIGGNGVTITPNGGDAGNTVSLTDKGLNNGNNQVTNVSTGLKGRDGNNVTLANASGDVLNNAVNVGDLKDSVHNLTNATTGGFGLTDEKGNDVKADLGKTVTVQGDGSVKTEVVEKDGKKALQIGLTNNVTVGNDKEPGIITVKGENGKDGVSISGKDGIGIKGENGQDAVSINGKDGDGTVAVKGKDGKTGVALNGKDGTIGINGKDGSNGSITVAQGEKGLAGNDGANGTTKTRIVYEKPNGDKEEVATLNDGLNFVGNDGKAIAKKLNETLAIKGNLSTAVKEVTANNLRVDNVGDELIINMAKALTDLTSATFTNKDGNKSVVDGNGLTITPKGGNASNTVSLTTTGLNNGGNKVINVANGTISATSTDAVNGSQLYAVSEVANKGWNLQTNGGKAENVKPGDTVNFANGNNIAITNDGTKVTVGLVKNVDLGEDGSIKAGDTLVNNEGVKVGDNVSLTKDGLKAGNVTISATTGINAGDKQITNVKSGLGGTKLSDAKGTTLTNAANIGDLQTAVSSVTDASQGGGFGLADDKGANVTQNLGKTIAVKGDGKNISTVVNGDALTVNLNKDVDLGNDGSLTIGNTTINSDQVKVGDVTVSSNGKVSGVADGDISPNSTEAINGSQLYTTNQNVANYLGGGSKVDDKGNVTAPTYTITKVDGNTTTANNVGDAITNLNNEVVKPLTFAGDTGAASERKLGSTVTVKGGVQDSSKLSENNIGVVSDGKGTLAVKLAKDIKVDSVEAKIVNANTVNANTVKAGDTTINSDGVTIKDGPSVTKSGINAAGNRITNVRAGQADTDAVNVSQLKGAVGHVNQRINKVNKELRAGIAGANAAAGLPQAYIPGKSMMAVAAGTYKNESALAVGYSRSSDNGKVILKLQGNANTRGDLGGSVGVGYQW
ncbi:YadA-like family protein [Actinobacillus genomosp. 1]|uniref:YadA-like family protein n=1 Tax=Actinobacillus genomosp. 1 TaxID=254839 RepID=UPI0024413588|nr:YadA-like family protein [Actinobacillus genomosp. 1]WGE36495.1 YadA-like family protein [Actinobacillus genomosp. 1]